MPQNPLSGSWQSVENDNTLGTSGATTVSWRETTASGLTASPASGTITAPAGGTASTTVTVTAPASLAPGYYQVTFAWVVDTNVNNVVPVTVATGTPGAAVEVGNVPDGVTVTG